VNATTAVIVGVVVLGVGVIAYMLIKSQSESNIVDAAASIL
jgi:hypothetical protein